MSKLWEAIKDLERQRDHVLHDAQIESPALVAYLDEIRHRPRRRGETTNGRTTELPD